MKHPRMSRRASGGEIVEAPSQGERPGRTGSLQRRATQNKAGHLVQVKGASAGSSGVVDCLWKLRARQMMEKQQN